MSNGPIFEAQPGWGGKLGAWMRGNLVYLVPGLAVVVLIIVLVATGGNDNNGTTGFPTASPISTQLPVGTLSQTVVARDNYTLVARRAITAYIATTSVTETAGQRLYAETLLQSQIQTRPLTVGGTITLQKSQIQSILDGYAKLYPSQRTKWEAMASRVKF